MYIEPPFIDAGGDNISLSFGEPLILMPTINFGVPRATINWYFNNGAIDPSDPRVDISGLGHLTVMNMQAGDIGTYTLRAYNTGGDASANFTVIGSK